MKLSELVLQFFIKFLFIIRTLDLDSSPTRNSPGSFKKRKSGVANSQLESDKNTTILPNGRQLHLPEVENILKRKSQYEIKKNILNSILLNLVTFQELTSVIHQQSWRTENLLKRNKSGTYRI